MVLEPVGSGFMSMDLFPLKSLKDTETCSAPALGASPVRTDGNENAELIPEQTHLSLFPAEPTAPPGRLPVLIKTDCFKASWQILLKQPPPRTQIITATFMVE